MNRPPLRLRRELNKHVYAMGISQRYDFPVYGIIVAQIFVAVALSAAVGWVWAVWDVKWGFPPYTDVVWFVLAGCLLVACVATKGAHRVTDADFAEGDGMRAYMWRGWAIAWFVVLSPVLMPVVT